MSAMREGSHGSTRFERMTFAFGGQTPTLPVAEQRIQPIAKIGYRKPRHARHHPKRTFLVLRRDSCSNSSCASSKSFVPAPSTTRAMTGARTMVASRSRPASRRSCAKLTAVRRDQPVAPASSANAKDCNSSWSAVRSSPERLWTHSGHCLTFIQLCSRSVQLTEGC